MELFSAFRLVLPDGVPQLIRRNHKCASLAVQSLRCVALQEQFAPNIYYFDPLLAGPRRSWSVHLSRCKALGFNHVVSAPLFDPGESGDLFLASDHERANPAIEPATAVDLIVAEFARACQENSLQLLLDVVVGRVATNCTIAKSRPEWFSPRRDRRASRSARHARPRRRCSGAVRRSGHRQANCRLVDRAPGSARACRSRWI